jgi:hypothetical protein
VNSHHHDLFVGAASAVRLVVPAMMGVSAAFAAAETPFPSYVPLRAPLLAQSCATPDDDGMADRLTSYCAGYLRAVLENDPRLGHCHPLMANVMEEIIARQHRTQLTDDDVLARDFVVEVARDLCRRAGG